MAGSCPDRAHKPIGFFDCTGFPRACSWFTGEREIECACNTGSGIGFCCASDAPPTCGGVMAGGPCCPSFSPGCPGPGGTQCSCVSGMWFCAGDPDLGVPVSCFDEFQCLLGCSTPGCTASCTAAAPQFTTQLAVALEVCARNACAADGGAPDDACVQETLSGVSPSGAPNGLCCAELDPATSQCRQIVDPPVPPCGACVDALFNCQNFGPE
jgi:hypothetical protein